MKQAVATPTMTADRALGKFAKEKDQSVRQQLMRGGF
jgi:hypothetical protein